MRIRSDDEARRFTRKRLAKDALRFIAGVLFYIVMFALVGGSIVFMYIILVG